MNHLTPLQFPLRPVGTLVLNENPQNYFGPSSLPFLPHPPRPNPLPRFPAAEIEQIAFSPSHLIRGVEPTADPTLQSRLFSYPDTHRHRLGVNYAQLPINAPLHPPVNFQRDGFACFDNQGARPNYISTIQPLRYAPQGYSTEKHEQFVGASVRDLSVVTELDLEQPRALWERVFDEKAKERFVGNVVGHLGAVKSKAVLERTIAVL